MKRGENISNRLGIDDSSVNHRRQFGYVHIKKPGTPQLTPWLIFIE